MGADVTLQPTPIPHHNLISRDISERLLVCFFRDGVETEENMSRWMTNNYTLKGFWRGWHCSFNRWLVRYIYVPLGGSGDSGAVRMRNVFCVFTFVALWHDMTLQLLLWGWLSAVAFAPEALVEWVGSLPRVVAFTKGKWWVGNLAALLGSLNVLLLIVANMIGFATAAGGTATILTILTALASREGFSEHTRNPHHDLSSWCLTDRSFCHCSAAVPRDVDVVQRGGCDARDSCGGDATAGGGAAAGGAFERQPGPEPEPEPEPRPHEAGVAMVAH